MAGIAGVIPPYPVFVHDGVYGQLPSYWYGTADRDGDAEPWIRVVPGSMYFYWSGSALTIYVKDADNVGGS